MPVSFTSYPYDPSGNSAPPAESVDTRLEKGRQCMLNLDYFQAGALFEQCLAIQPDHVPALINLAQVLFKRSHISQALAAFRKALDLSPNNLVAMNGIGNCYMVEGNNGKAIRQYEMALKADPEYVGSMYNLALLRNHSPNASLVKQLERLHESPDCTGDRRVLACFALARISEGCGDLHRAFRYYEEANAVQFSLVNYNEARTIALFEDVQASFTSSLFHRLRHVGRTDATPIFVLGMPRSGTTLVTQILASHSGVYGAGETSIMPNIGERIIPQITGMPFTRAVASMDAPAFAGIANLYLQQLSAYCPGITAQIVDKTPSDFFMIGLIRLLFPRAPIIHCVRDPMDTCWSLFRQNFGWAHGYCYDQRALGRYYRRYQRLMDHWHKVLPGEIHDVQYEEMVAQPERTIRALLEYCGLPWEDRCLAFYRTKRVVNTASAVQVRRPIYKTSIKSWLPVAEELAPLRAALDGL